MIAESVKDYRSCLCFWSLLKRCFKETWISVELHQLFRYLNEEDFRFNEREGEEADRFKKAVGSVAGRRLIYSEPTGSDAAR